MSLILIGLKRGQVNSFCITIAFISLDVKGLKGLNILNYLKKLLKCKNGANGKKFEFVKFSFFLM